MMYVVLNAYLTLWAHYCASFWNICFFVLWICIQSM